MSERVDSLYICPWSLRDPLCQSQSLAYIRGLVAAGYKFALITFETAQHKLDEAALAEQKRDLKQQGIYWYPVNWPGGNSISEKLGGITSVIAQGIRICRRHRPRLIHSRSSLPVFAAVTLKKLFGTKFLYDADSLLSQEYLDVGHLTSKSTAYKFLAWSESWARKNANHIIVLTKKLRNLYLEEFGVKIPVDVIPCCVDNEKFRFDPIERRDRRKQLSLGDDSTLLIYVGKSGPRYLVDLVFALYRELRLHRSTFLLILSGDDKRRFVAISRPLGIPEDAFMVLKAPEDEVAGWLSAADIGLAFIKPTQAEIGGSPIKIAEYLINGLPVVINEGIGDLSDFVEAGKLGTVVGEPFSVTIGEAVRKLSRKRPIDDQRKLNDLVKEHYSLNDVGVEGFCRIYSRIIDK